MFPERDALIKVLRAYSREFSNNFFDKFKPIIVLSSLGSRLIAGIGL